MKFHITVQTTGARFDVRARTYEQAAIVAARRLNGRSATAHRVTGTTGKSGVFGIYRYDRRLMAENRIGSDVHVRA